MLEHSPLSARSIEPACPAPTKAKGRFMPRENMISFIKKSLLGALCVAIVSAGVAVINMVLEHEKILPLIVFKLDTLEKKIDILVDDSQIDQ